MKIESFFATNIVYLLAFFPIAISIFIFFKLKLKTWIWEICDVGYLLGGLVYWIFYEFTPLIKGKTLSDFILELSCIGSSCSLLFLLRSILGLKFPNKSKSFSIFSMLIILVIVILFGALMPSSPE